MIALPIDDYLSEISDRLTQIQNLVLTAAPGTGKTTRLPYLLLDSKIKKIAVLEPRRLAAVGAANRICAEQKLSLGEEVGYQVRGDSRISSHTKLIFMTEAILLRRMISDPELNAFDLIIIDEFHERNLNQDLAMGLIRELQEMGREIKVLIMSATLNPKPLLNYWPESDHIDIPGKLFPLELKYSSQKQRLSLDHSFFNQLAESIKEAYRNSEGDVLVFLPGKSEIRRCQRLLDANIECLTLHGSMSLEDQKKIFALSERKRVILSTNIAEASLTIPGVRWVIDTGLEKNSEFNSASGFSKLNLQRISLFSARQRAGRAARTGAGVCQRLWNQKEEEGFSEQAQPEIKRSDLSSALLYLYALGVPDAQAFHWFESPSRSQINMANSLLYSLDAIDENNKITEIGKELLAFPVSLNLARLLHEAKKSELLWTAAVICVLIEEPNLLTLDPNQEEDCDVLARLRQLQNGSHQRGLIFKKAKSLLKSEDFGRIEVDPEKIKKILLLSHLGRLCRRRKNSNLGLMLGGRGVELDQSSAAKNSEFFLSLSGLDLPQRANTSITMACGLDREFLLKILGHRIELKEEIRFENNKFYRKTSRCVLGLAIEDPKSEIISPNEDMLKEQLNQHWSKILLENEELSHFFKRLAFYEYDTGSQIWTEELSNQLQSYACLGKSSWDELLKQDFSALAQSLVPQDDMATMNQFTPRHFVAPSGLTLLIDYSDLQRPKVSCKVQELYSLKQHPKLGSRQIPLCFELLAPNFRPTQITSDILTFWQSSYHEVRKDLRARYPKHFWPEDPLAALPKKRR